MKDYAFNSSTLETIHMRNCKFLFFKEICNHETIFSLCPKLMNLELINNRFSQNDKFLQKLFRPLHNRRFLSLSFTKLSKLPLQVFSYMKALKHLNLAGNRITGWQYPGDIFGNDSTINVLDLSQNLISVVNESTFPRYLRESLQKINLGNNPLIWVHSELLREIESNNGFRLCIHHRNFDVGQTITSNVDNFLTKAWKVIVIMSNDFAMSEWCQWAIEVVQERRRKHGKDGVILVMLANIDSKHMTSSLRTLLDSTPYLRYQRGVGEVLFWNALVEALNKPIGHHPVAVV
ncbi:unnamed protein product [Mytilus edulis]|uniref:TIR domain-containing protein n=1 Tax=Mytilus edulis TaxID=6550 RepID=A0A8S3UG08_MYTED|nr:unnamed protein product [Mytilus edulis]